MPKNKRVTMWVDPDFRRELKRKCLDTGHTSILSLTKEMAREMKNKDILPRKERRKSEHRFF